MSKVLCRQFLREQQVGYEAVKHQRFVGTGSFDSVQQERSTLAPGARSSAHQKGFPEGSCHLPLGRAFLALLCP